MDIIETSDTVKIIFTNSSIPYDSIYNREYFLLLDIETFENDEDKMRGGVHQYSRKKIKLEKNKDVANSTIDNVDTFVHSSSSELRESAGDVIQTVENKISDVSNAIFNSSKKEIIIKKKAKTDVIILHREMDSVYDRSKNIFEFDSGYTYDEYSRIIKDLFIQISYLFFLDIKVGILDVKNIYKINNRYVLLEEKLEEKADDDSRESCFIPLEKIMVELTGKQYQRGEYIKQLKEIEGTEVYKYREFYFA